MSSPKTPLQGFEARLIHRDSPESPLYNPKATRADLEELSAHRRSIARQKYLARLISRKKWGTHIRAPIDVVCGDYIFKYKIGKPPIETFGFFDTAGSTLIWLQCDSLNLRNHPP